MRVLGRRVISLTSQKEVERRRRENINEGINDLAKLIPEGTDKMGKGAFLRRAVEHLEGLTTKNKEFENLISSLDHDKGEMQVSFTALALGQDCFCASSSARPLGSR